LSRPVKLALAAILVLAGVSAALAQNDPARDYLSNFSPLDGDKTIYSTDTLLRLELDLDGDGQYEVLLSMARDQDGKLGNVWAVYANTAAGYTKAGTITFNPKSFYLGPIEDLGDYGLVTFKPTGESEGMLSAYLFSDTAVRDIDIASGTRDSPTVDSDTGRPIGQAIVDKYMNQTADAADAVTSTNAATLAKQYGLKVAGDQQTPSLQTASSPSSPAPSQTDPSSSPRPPTEAFRSFPWTLLIVILFLALVAIGGMIWLRRR
jgi:hypothetical protein